MKKTFAALVLACAGALTLCGCASYYKVTDPATTRVYYTQSIENRGGGAIRFKDEASRNTVTLSTSEVIEITRDQFDANVHSR